MKGRNGETAVDDRVIRVELIYLNFEAKLTRMEGICVYCAIEQAENSFDIRCTHLTADDNDLSKIGIAARDPQVHLRSRCCSKQLNNGCI